MRLSDTISKVARTLMDTDKLKEFEMEIDDMLDVGNNVISITPNNQNTYDVELAKTPNEDEEMEIKVMGDSFHFPVRKVAESKELNKETYLSLDQYVQSYEDAYKRSDWPKMSNYIQKIDKDMIKNKDILDKEIVNNYKKLAIKDGKLTMNNMHKFSLYFKKYAKSVDSWWGKSLKSAVAELRKDIKIIHHLDNEEDDETETKNMTKADFDKFVSTFPNDPRSNDIDYDWNDGIIEITEES